MKKNIILFLFILLGLFSLSALAEIYQSVDSNGVVTYSDQPKTDSTAVALPEANIAVVPPSTPAKTNHKTKSTDTETTDHKENGTDEKAVRKSYTVFELATPADQETLQNPTDISMSVNIQPELQPGDTIAFFLDDKAVNKPSSSTSATISKTDDNTVNFERGSHTIHAVLYNSNNEIIKTTPAITVFVHYASVNFPKR